MKGVIFDGTEQNRVLLGKHATTRRWAVLTDGTRVLPEYREQLWVRANSPLKLDPLEPETALTWSKIRRRIGAVWSERVIVESPYAGDVERNTRYLMACLRDCLLRGEAPFASHAIYTLPGVLDDLDPEERELGMKAGFEWTGAAHRTVVYVDLGISPGMKRAIEHRYDDNIGYRSLWGWGPE